MRSPCGRQKWTEGNFWKAATKLLLFFSTFSFLDEESIKERRGMETFQFQKSSSSTVIMTTWATKPETVDRWWIASYPSDALQTNNWWDAGCWNWEWWVYIYCEWISLVYGTTQIENETYQGCFVSWTISTFPLLMGFWFPPQHIKFLLNEGAFSMRTFIGWFSEVSQDEKVKKTRHVK